MSVTAIKRKQKNDDQAAEGGEKKAKGGKKKLLLIVVALLVVAGAAYWFVLKPSGAAEEGPKPGAILPLESTQINLASGHYLKIGIALQLVEGAPEEVDGSKALDATIELFSGRTIEEVANPRDRKELKEDLEATLEKSYEDEVMGVYFTEFVTQ
ncbi:MULTISPECIES: flagellar basal body-associated FliL family protein [unclassified Nocardioides]|uniref:flagellar basal body-associated FliL family protein n=1 Tax=unclassified Nocardioides TaxID=2615069 RepID=UPI0000571270|nr:MULTISPECIES: flagellar basal body-associated FliL family protein [unclassified Nocardioides]ABL80272.1 flagellar basal body-associated protein FliL [Nocardioides sp. JS614]